MQPKTTNDLIEEVRQGLDEDNTEDVSDSRILKALNKGATNCYHILAKQFDQFFLASTTIVTDGTDTISIPTDAFGRRVEYVTYSESNIDHKVHKISPTKMYKAAYNSSTYPAVYTTKGDKIVLAPTPKSGLTLTVSYMRKPSTLVKSGGRIIDITGDVVTVDTLGSDIGIDVDNLSAFVNIVDYATGVRKASMQIDSINGTVVTFKTSSLDRSTVYGITLDTSIPTDVAVDDYICGIGGTTIIELLSDYSDYIVQYAIVNIKRAMRLPVDADFPHLKDLEKHIETIWAGRENDQSITHRNSHWNRRTHRY